MGNFDSLPPQEFTFGDDFNYQKWTANTEITLCNVPWANDYRDVVYFDSTDRLDNYLLHHSGPTIDYKNVTRITPGRPIRISAPMAVAYKYNYLRVYNGLMPIDGDEARPYYYFITDLQEESPSSVLVNVQLDVWQSFSHQVKFGRCYIEQGHIGIANEKQFDNNGRSYLTIPEGLDIGSEYWITGMETHQIASAAFNDYGVLVASTVDLVQSGGTTDAPKLVTAGGSPYEGLPNGCALYYFGNLINWIAFCGLLSGTPWVSSGIISCVIVPSNSIDYSQAESQNVMGAQFWRLNKQTSVRNTIVNVMQNFRGSIEIPDRYKILKKFQVSPYSVVELTTNSGTPIVLKPECVQSDDIEAVQLSHIAPPSPRIGFYPLNYNKSPSLGPLIYSGDVDPAKYVFMSRGEDTDMMTLISDFPQFSVTNDGYLNYMASNHNSIQYQYQSATWDQSRTMAAAQNSYNQASMGMQTANSQTASANSAALNQARLANLVQGERSLVAGGQAVVGAVGSAASDNIGGAITGLISGAGGALADYMIGTQQTNGTTAISNQLRTTQNDLSVGQMGYNRDTNMSYAQFAANGDYQNKIAGINAKVNDAKMTQPTTSGQIGGDAFNLATTGWFLIAKVKTLEPGAMANVGEYWLRYGYQIHRWGNIPSDFKCMDHFTYWKLMETYLVSSGCPEGFKQTIRGIFEKGVTVWTSPDYLGNTDPADNLPVDGISL